MFKTIVFVLGPEHGQKIIDYLDKNVWVSHGIGTRPEIKFVWQTEPLGFGHAVLQAKSEVFAWNRWNPPVLVQTDDTIILSHSHNAERYRMIQDMTLRKGSQLGTQWTEHPEKYGIVLVKGDRISGALEKPSWIKAGYALTGMYYIRNSRQLFRNLKELCGSDRKIQGEYQFTSALQAMINEGEYFASYNQEWIDVGSKDFGEG